MTLTGIRLVDLSPGEYAADIKCELHDVPLGEDEHYETVSYIWGDGSNVRPIQLSDQTVHITETLFLVLKRLRSRTTVRRLWVDQLCIMQWDNEDKTRQVNMMRKIYTDCARCVIWLGEVEPENGITIDDAVAALDFVKLCAEGPRHGFSTSSDETERNTVDARSTGETFRDELRVYSDWVIPPSLSSPARLSGASRAFSKLSARENPWWSRIWTVQEAVLPQKALVQWGPLSIDWDTVEKAASNLCSLRVPIPPISILEPFEDSMHHFTGGVRGLLIARDGEDPLDLLQRWRYRGCTDPRDKVYALMGLYASMPLVHVPSCDYTISAATLYVNVTYDLICLQQNLRPLVGLRECSTPNLPSWALDLACCPDAETWLWWWNHSHRYSWYQADGGKALNCKLLQGSALSVTGAPVDVIIQEIGRPLTLPRGQNLTTKGLIETIKAWYEMILEYMCRQPDRDQNPYGNAWSIAFWRTLIADIIMDEFPIRRATVEDAERVRSYYDNLKWSEVCPSLQYMIPNQSFFITAKGYIGLGPPDMRIGDEIWVLRGGSVPFMLRKHDCSLGYTLLGDTYVHGIMDGEASRCFEHAEGEILVY